MDASALYPLILILREEIVDHYGLLSVLDLTFYEVGNAVWKEYRRGLVTDPKPLLELFKKVFSNIRVTRLGVDDFSKVLQDSCRRGLNVLRCSLPLYC